MDNLDDFFKPQAPTALRPLLGLTVLVVEDSRFACEAMRLMCLRSGARIRRADCLSSARRHLQVYRPSVVIIDVGLPDGSGIDLIAELHAATPRVDVLLATSGDTGARTTAITAGADAFLEKPMTSVAAFQTAILAQLPADKHPMGPRKIENDVIVPDLIAYRDDLAHAADLLATEDEAKHMAYVTQFLAGVAEAADDAPLAEIAQGLARQGASPESETVSRLAGMLQDRLDGRMAL